MCNKFRLLHYYIALYCVIDFLLHIQLRNFSLCRRVCTVCAHVVWYFVEGGVKDIIECDKLRNIRVIDS